MSRKKKIVLAIIIVTLILLLYAAFNPECSRFFPPCPFRLLTGLQCPSCGSQRALHYLLMGDISKALSYNYFLIYSIPYAALVVYVSYFDTSFSRKIKKWVIHPYVVYTYCVLFILWWIIRNI